MTENSVRVHVRVHTRTGTHMGPCAYLAGAVTATPADLGMGLCAMSTECWVVVLECSG